MLIAVLITSSFAFATDCLSFTFVAAIILTSIFCDFEDPTFIISPFSKTNVIELKNGEIKEFKIDYEVDIVSAHRTPEKMFKYASDASDNGIKVIIAGAGGAAHLPGMVASITTLPVIGVPVKSRNSIDGWDSVLSILQMPNGVPVATVALNGAKNAGILAAQIIGISDSEITKKLVDYKSQLEKKVYDSEKNL